MYLDGCTYLNRSSEDKTISFHKIPPEKNNKLRKQWVHNIRRTGSLPKDSGFYICSVHFTPDCFQRDMDGKKFKFFISYAFFFF